MQGSIRIEDPESHSLIQREELISNRDNLVEVTDLYVENLPASTNEESLRRESGAAHIIKSVIDVDNIR